MISEALGKLQVQQMAVVQKVKSSRDIE